MFCFCLLALLCGMSGYAAFIDEYTSLDILRWQVIESGCFQYYDDGLFNNNTNSEKIKRTATFSEDNCSDHMTGLGAAIFGLFAKISNDFQEYS